MTNPAPGTLAWFEIATGDADGAEKFYGSLFDWSFEADGPAATRSPRTINLVDGRLRLVARRFGRQFTCHSQLGDFRTRLASAAVTTRGRFSQAYGRFAFRARLPRARVAGTHSALWLYPNQHMYGAWPLSGEVDVAEWYSAMRRRIFPSVHYVDGATTSVPAGTRASPT